MIDIHTAKFFTDLQQREMELRAQRRQLLIEARVASDPTSPAFPRQPRSTFRVALSAIPGAARDAIQAGRSATTSRSH